MAEANSSATRTREVAVDAQLADQIAAGGWACGDCRDGNKCAVLGCEKTRALAGAAPVGG